MSFVVATPIYYALRVAYVVYVVRSTEGATFMAMHIIWNKITYTH